MELHLIEDESAPLDGGSDSADIVPAMEEKPQAQAPITIVIADDHQVVRAGL